MTHIYVEGDSKLRSGFQTLFERFARLKVILCDDKDNTRKVWNKHKGSTGERHLLLIDSDGPVNGTPPNDEFFMVQEMESWFLVDSKILKTYYGDDFNPNSIPKRPVEGIPDPKGCLKDATKNSKKGRYHEVLHGGDLLKLIDLETVRNKAPNLDRLVRRLEDLKS